jgi:pimeloyl-ACP methyl ester carboxylesterase
MKKGYIDVPEGQMHYRMEGRGDPLVLLHQAPLSSEEFMDMIPVLSRHFLVIAPDMMGHGNSDDPPSEFAMADYERCLLRFLDALDIEAPLLFGNHSGGALALSAAVNHPGRVKKLIVSGEACVSTERVAAFLESLKTKPLSREVPMTEDGAFLVDAWNRYKALAPSAKPEVRFKPFIIGQAARIRPYDAHYAVLRWMAEENRLPRVQCPTLVFFPDKDILHSDALVEAAGRYLPGCSTAVIQDAGAMVCFEKPQEVAELIIDFLA